MHETTSTEAANAAQVTRPKRPTQLWLWPPPRPLVERFGSDFFRRVPASPGVYLLCGPDAGVLYVGKAKDLRRRLATYRVANPERLPRRMLRLLQQVTRIEWDLCSTEAAAEHREELLICVLNPKFNRAGKVWPSPTAWRDWQPSAIQPQPAAVMCAESDQDRHSSNA